MNQYGGNNPNQSYGGWGQGAQSSSSGLGYSAQAIGGWDQGAQSTSGWHQRVQGANEWNQSVQGANEWSQSVQGANKWNQSVQGANEWSQSAQGISEWSQGVPSQFGNQSQPLNHRLQKMAGVPTGSQNHPPVSSTPARYGNGHIPGVDDYSMIIPDKADSWQERPRNKFMYKNPSTYNNPTVSNSIKNVFDEMGDGHWSGQQHDQHKDRPITNKYNDQSNIVDLVSRELTDAGLPSATVAKVMQAVAKNKGNSYDTMSNFSNDNRPINRGNGIDAGYGRKRSANVASTEHGIGGAVPNRNSSYGSYEYDDHNPSIRNQELGMSSPSRGLSMRKRRLHTPLHTMSHRPGRQYDVVDEDFAPSGANYYDDEEDYLGAPQSPSYGTAALRRRPRNPILQNADGSSRVGRIRKPPSLLSRRLLIGTPTRRRGSPRLVGNVRLPRSASMASASAASTLITEVPRRNRQLAGEQMRTMRALRKETLMMRRLRMSQMRRMKRLELLGYRGRATEGLPEPSVGPSSSVGGEYNADDTWDTLTQGERSQVLKFRQDKGCVFYIRYKSDKITEADLKLLAQPFGRVSRVFIIKAKETQAFMALERPDDAADMLQHYMLKQAVIKGCKILLKASSYSEWSKKAADSLKTPRTRNRPKKKKKKAANVTNQVGNGTNQAANNGKTAASTTAVASTSTTAAASTSKTTAAASTSKTTTAASTSKTTAAASTSGSIKDRLGPKVKGLQQQPGGKKGGPQLTPAQLAARKASRLAKRQRQKANKKRRLAEAAAAAEAAAGKAVKEIKVNEVSDLRHVIGGSKKTGSKKQENEETAKDQSGEPSTNLFVEDDLEYPSNLLPDEIQVPENDDPVYVLNEMVGTEKATTEEPEENSVIEIKDQSVIEIKDQSVIEVKDQSVIVVKDESVIEVKHESVTEEKD